MKVSIIANPVSGRGSAFRAVERYVASWRHPGWEVEVLTTNNRNHAGLLAEELLERGTDLLAICGGDGTINEVVSRVPDPPFPVAILPAGTANVVARELGLPLNPVGALKIALNRSVKRVDLGELGPHPGRRFLFVAGIGLDAYIVSRVPSKLKAKLGIAAYVITTVRCLQSYNFPEFNITAGGESLTATSCVIANAKSYGGGLLFTPAAEMNNGFLDVLVLQGRRRLELAYFLFQAWRGKPEMRDWIHRFRASSLRIEGPRDIFIQTDGELAGGLPREVSIIPSIFPIVTP
jgi:diacylglycerol kinase (ATP)